MKQGAPKKGTTLAERFWNNVRKTEGCWLWLGKPLSNGYGQFAFGGRNRMTGGKIKRDLAHRMSWRLTYGEISAGLNVLHKCDVPTCVNPVHLFLGTQLDNVKDMTAKGRHVGTRGQTWFLKDGRRVYEIRA